MLLGSSMGCEQAYRSARSMHSIVKMLKGWNTIVGRHRRWTAVLGVAASLAAFTASVTGSNAAPGDAAKCPLKSSSTIPPGDAWAFHETGPPSASHPGVISSYTHGRGEWRGGRGSGTICQEDTPTSGPPHKIVLPVAGSASVSPRVTRLGHLGVVLVLNVSVADSDDPTCLSGTRGTVTIFASYYEGHHDSVKVHFNGSCTAYSATFLGPRVYALISANGHQVN